MQSPAIDTQMIYRWIRKNEEKLCAFHAGMREEMDLFNDDAEKGMKYF